MSLPIADKIRLLVHGHQDIWDPQQRCDIGMTLRLRQHALASVQQNHRKGGGRRARRHIAGVLFVAGRVRDNEFAARRREISVGNIDRDPLLAFYTQAIGQQREIDRPAGAVHAALFYRRELISIRTRLLRRTRACQSAWIFRRQRFPPL